MSLLGGKSEEEQFEAILANKYCMAAKKDAEASAPTAVRMRSNPFASVGVLRSLRDFALLDREDKGY